MAAKEKADAAGWQAFQTRVSTLKLQRTRVEREAAEVSSALGEAERDIAHVQQQRR